MSDSRDALVIGVDLGTSSARAVVADARDGAVLGHGVAAYRRGRDGVIEDPRDPNLARQHPRDHFEAFDACVRAAVEDARSRGVEPARVAAIGVDATGSTPMPVDTDGAPLALAPEFDADPGTMAWLWKDHTAHAEAREIEERARALDQPYLNTTVGKYSSEWFWAKALRLRRSSPALADRAAGWAELGDVIVARASGVTSLDAMPRGVCAAGHKGMFDRSWGGYASAEFLDGLAPGLSRWRPTGPVLEPGARAGRLSESVARATGLEPGIVVASAMLDAHAGAIGAGVAPGTLVKIIGTSACDCLVGPADRPPRFGVSGAVPDSIIPGLIGIEAGQPAFGDLFDWHARSVGGENAHERLTREAEAFKPGECGLLALDWWNGNRSILNDSRLSGLIVGMNLGTTPGATHRALFEAAAFGARRIIKHFDMLGIPVTEIVACGGIPEKNPLVTRILADVCGRPILVRGGARACALGSAILAAVASGIHSNIHEAQRAMVPEPDRRHEPDPDAHDVYVELYKLYLNMHDAMGEEDSLRSLGGVMKRLIAIREQATGP